MKDQQSQLAFRDYATRVSFNLSLSRNQIGHLAAAVLEIEHEGAFANLNDRCDGKRVDKLHGAVVQAGGNPSNFVVGYGSLIRMGLLIHDPRWLAARESEVRGAFWKYTGPAHQLTEAGAHVVALLRLAGLIPKSAVNDRVKKRRAA
jgi:hypothetical protein